LDQTGAVPGAGVGCRFHPVLKVGAKTLREKHDRGHASLVDSVHHGLRRADVKGERFVEQEVAACSGSADGQVRLDIRRDRD